MHTPCWEPSLSVCTPAGQRIPEHPCFELISALRYHRNTHLGKQSPCYLTAQGIKAQLLLWDAGRALMCFALMPQLNTCGGFAAAGGGEEPPGACVCGWVCRYLSATSQINPNTPTSCLGVQWTYLCEMNI